MSSDVSVEQQCVQRMPLGYRCTHVFLGRRWATVFQQRGNGSNCWATVFQQWAPVPVVAQQRSLVIRDACLVGKMRQTNRHGRTHKALFIQLKREEHLKYF